MSNTQEAKEANINRIYYNLDEVGDEAWKAYIRGLNYCQNKEYQQGIAEFDRAIQLFPDFAQAYCERGLTYYVLIIPDDQNEVSVVLEKFRTLSTFQHKLSHDQSRCCLDLYYALAIKPDVENADLAREALEALFGDTYWQEAKAYGEEMVRTDPDHAPPCLVYRKQAFAILAQQASQVKDKTRIDAEIARLQRDPPMQYGL